MALPAGSQIRHAVREDVPMILQLIQELADYEKEPNAVEATEESLLATISFDDSTPISGSRPARCLVAYTPDNKPAAIALYFYNYSTWRSKPGIYLEDLFVRESERGHGYGQRLLGLLAKQTLDMNGGRLEWCVLKWNEPSIKFYERIGAKALSEWQTMRVEGEALENLAKRGA
ncbi:Gcn5-related n-acetyltransferase [Coleophoma crateriformis]|uniref:Gcn5-related n-acetyltransferase n=1 Tax=Coleophoma crateriformis TaxID=565419 RepID=A0A3D8S312_9HELO|nr:Gcn5-related n-acetyltransferase [Coleophoma crateriformis]